MPARQPPDADGMLSQDLLEDQSAEDPDGSFYTGDDPDLSFYNGNNLDTSFLDGDDPDKSFYDRDDNDYLDESDTGPPWKSSEDIIQSRAQSGFACREVPVKEANKVFRRYHFLNIFFCPTIFPYLKICLLRLYLALPTIFL